MISIRKAADRGITRTDWLESRHTFSFAEYYDPKQLGFRSLRVINEDRVIPGAGFATHSHRDMEIITYVVEGALEHKDSLGNGSVIKPREAQRMSAGTGIRHSEFNASQNEPVHFLQIWIVPERTGLPPGYEQKQLSLTRGEFNLIAARESGHDQVVIHQDVKLYVGLAELGTALEYRLAPDRHAWIQIVKGEIAITGAILSAGDGAVLTVESVLRIEPKRDSELLLFDLA
jgi:redox-sensitive bicupin YhaK (pirin superfamily)